MKPTKEGRELKALREGLGLTQGAMAEALGVQRNTVWRAEHGRRPSRVMMTAARLLARVRELEGGKA